MNYPDAVPKAVTNAWTIPWIIFNGFLRVNKKYNNGIIIKQWIIKADKIVITYNKSTAAVSLKSSSSSKFPVINDTIPMGANLNYVIYLNVIYHIKVSTKRIITASNITKKSTIIFAFSPNSDIIIPNTVQNTIIPKNIIR